MPLFRGIDGDEGKVALSDVGEKTRAAKPRAATSAKPTCRYTSPLSIPFEQWLDIFHGNRAAASYWWAKQVERNQG